MALPALILWFSLAIDRAFGDPQSRLHPVSLLGSFIGLWGRPGLYPVWSQRFVGVFFSILTASLFALPFYLIWNYLPVIFLIIAAPFLLKICFAWRCLEEHVSSVEKAVSNGGGRNEVQMLVSRDANRLSDEEVLSAAYESMAENLVDSIISPLFYFTIFGLPGAAFFRAVNTMDAMLGYKDHRIYLGWFPARMDDFLNYIPARFTGAVLLFYFALKGRFRQAWKTLLRDRKKRPGFNGGIPMSVIAGGVGIEYSKPGCYVIGNPEKLLSDGGKEIFQAVRAAAIISSVIFTLLMFIFGGIMISVLF
ncbi:cobalamin biosynthesis protein CobD [Methanoplanus sp. FWC-SCC4]|uniref:Probable cobalamin biosynthesis protein CobD n=1 Tax=Methanochimaera problematica TaxID=2609417 RepID=A0AA97FF68_9EURY|nr:adenosylcobinamide-phosphate synthase CbiB [Methanoplanus sp. FWC-SCC4]WOF17178.1 cobalamin biosynthesis protein CobD [Methanoplanus sp. FWC-SCC4]